jgi:hypothetical protein
MAVIYTPPYSPNSMYRPNVFVTSQTTSDNLVLAVATILVDGVTNITSIRKPPAYTTGTAPITYFFEFDVSKTLQTVSAPNPKIITSVFAKDLNVNYNFLNTDCHTSVGLLIQYYYIDPVTNLLTIYPAVDIIGAGYNATIGTRQTLDYMGLDNYAIGYPTTPGVYDKYWLTKLPYVSPLASATTNNPILICKTENLTMSYIPTSGTNALRVIIYDQNQTVVGTAGYISVTPNSSYTPRTIGIGIPQLSLATYTAFNPTFGTNLANIPEGYYYSIQAGNLIAPSAFTLQGVKYMFKVVDCCANKVRLHWLNRLGGSDAYTFTNKKTVLESNTSEIAQKMQTWIQATPPSPSTYTWDKGRYKIQQTVLKEYEVESTFYDVSWGEWLAELLSSPEVYMETPSGLVSVVITDSQIKIEETNELINVTVKFTESNNISVQQN